MYRHYILTAQKYKKSKQSMYSVQRKKDPHKQISLFLVYFNILLRNFQRLFWTQFAITGANFIISTFVVQM